MHMFFLVFFGNNHTSIKISNQHIWLGLKSWWPRATWTLLTGCRIRAQGHSTTSEPGHWQDTDAVSVELPEIFYMAFLSFLADFCLSFELHRWDLHAILVHPGFKTVSNAWGPGCLSPAPKLQRHLSRWHGASVFQGSTYHGPPR